MFKILGMGRIYGEHQKFEPEHLFGLWLVENFPLLIESYRVTRFFLES